MNVDQLVPQPSHFEAFRRDRERFVPEASGCYVLTTFSRVVLYLGLAQNLRRRLNEHLDNPEKIKETKLGRAILFFWIETPDIHRVERTWMNTHIQHEGTLPELNKIYSPTAV